YFKQQKEEILANSLTEFDAEEAYRDIRNDGYEEGSRQKAEEAARNLFANGVSIELISKSLNMSEDEIRELTRDIVQKVELAKME
ncbi:MAG: hypothetical protein IKQ43_12575, partial [Treponema sp.]|nr:hypothetical protein [Treponema sp.]